LAWRGRAQKGVVCWQAGADGGPNDTIGEIPIESLSKFTEGLEAFYYGLCTAHTWCWPRIGPSLALSPALDRPPQMRWRSIRLCRRRARR
jgi:hypothetical protein